MSPVLQSLDRRSNLNSSPGVLLRSPSPACSLCSGPRDGFFEKKQNANRDLGVCFVAQSSYDFSEGERTIPDGNCSQNTLQRITLSSTVSKECKIKPSSSSLLGLALISIMLFMDVSLSQLAIIPGDGIGPEIMAVGKDVLEECGKLEGLSFSYTEAPIGGQAIDLTGSPLPEESLTICRASDACLMSSIGGYMRPRTWM